MLKTKKSKIIAIILLVFIILVAVTWKFCTFRISFTKDSYDTLQSVEKMIGQDIRDVQPIIDEATSQYNNKNSQYIYNNLFSKKVQETISLEDSNKTFKMLYNTFGKCLSYDMEKAQITIIKTNHGEITYRFFIPVKLEKWENGTIKVQIIKNKQNETKLYTFGLYTK